VGTFTPAGTFDAAIERLADLRDLGVTAIELMPIWQFPGERNWGYDGVLPYAVQHSYGGPAGLRRLVDAAHAHGIAVVLDVVYNHYGPEGNHLPDFGPYLTDRYDTPWGQAVNVDGPHSDEVRRYVVENAVRWVRDFHLDGLRLDAVHAIVDQSAVHVLEELATAVHAEAERLGRTVHLIAESDLADPRLVRSPEVGGYGLDAQWLDDVHHALHTAVTGERDGYFGDYEGFPDLARALRDRFVYAGRYSPHRGRRVGRPARDLPYDRFVVCTQNHDQVGNRMLGERRSVLVPFETLKLAAGALALLPFTPMLWMGQEYGEEAPFQYFVSHTEPALIEAVREGRQREFAYFAKDGLEAPDPQAEATFERSKLDWSLRDRGHHATLRALYTELLRLRRTVPPSRAPTPTRRSRPCTRPRP
jgi:maltooligosyltrehalose trehalohydrolase